MSLGDAAMPWSGEQQEWLAALGYTLYLTGAPSVAAEPVENEAAASQVAVDPAAIERSAAAERPARAQAPSLPEDATPARTAAPPRPAARPRAAGRLPDRLHFALIRASACNPNAEGAAEIFAQWPSSAELRGNPAAKRALWPRLRALRKQAPK